MTKQEEIREWLGRKFCLTLGYFDYNTPWGRRIGNQFADSILQYEDSQGVVIKSQYDPITLQELIDNGVVEPLI